MHLLLQLALGLQSAGVVFAAEALVSQTPQL